MGCWNGTCMISNLPIISGEKVKLIILRKAISSTRIFNSSAYVYSHDIFTPSFFPLSGVYNDYGMIEGVEEDWNYQLIEKYFKELFGNKIIADGETKENWTLIDVLDGVERHDLKYYGKPTKEDLRRQAMAVEACKVYGKQGFSSEKIEKEWLELRDMDTSETLRTANLSFVMIREDIWNHICGKYVGEFYNKDAKGPNDKDFYLSARKYCRIEFEKGLMQALKLKELLERDKTDKEDVLKELRGLISGGLAMNVFTRQNLDFIAPELYDKIAIDGDTERREDILNRYTEFTIISSFLSETRKGWMIQPGAGSQHDGWETHLMLAEKLVELCNEKLKEFEEDL
jgi:hypothetical protein